MPSHALKKLVAHIAGQIRRNEVVMPVDERLVIFATRSFPAFDRPGWAEGEFERRLDYPDDPTGAPKGEFDEESLEDILMIEAEGMNTANLYVAVYSKCQPDEPGALSIDEFSQELRTGLAANEEADTNAPSFEFIILVLPPHAFRGQSAA